jgi:hypothetical protein
MLMPPTRTNVGLLLGFVRLDDAYGEIKLSQGGG